MLLSLVLLLLESIGASALTAERCAIRQFAAVSWEDIEYKAHEEPKRSHCKQLMRINST
jgi:hypothetical protein